MKTSVVTQEKECNEQCSNNLKEFLALTFNNVSNGQQKKIGKKLKTCAQVLGMPSENENDEENNNQMNRETVGPKKNLKMITNRKEKQLNKVINGMKKQIDKLCLIIKMTCNSVACNDNLIKSVDDQLDEINNEVESEIQEVENSNKRRLENISKENN